MARTLDQIIGELGGTYNPQIDTLRARQAAIPEQIQNEEAGLGAKQEQAFGGILAGARRRGLGFSGIPLGEQAQYTATEYLPSLARLRQSGREQAMSLEDSINQIYERRNTLGQQIFQQEQDRDEQRRQFDTNVALQREQEARAARVAGGGFSPTLGGAGGSVGNPNSASVTQRADKGFSFTDSKGNPISAATFSAAKGIPFRQLLTEMAKAGDAGAKAALGFVGDDFGYDINKVNNQNAGIYNSLVWGTGRKIGK